MSQRKAERHPRRGTETRQRVKQVTVRLTLAEHAALAVAARLAMTSEPEMLRGLFLTALASGAYVPSAAQVHSWLRSHGWTSKRPGSAGSIWYHGDLATAVAVPGDDGLLSLIWGAVDRIARREDRPVADVVTEMLTISEEEPRG